MLYLKNYWWKILAVLILFFVFIAGLTNTVPRLQILNETIRNAFYHPPLLCIIISLPVQAQSQGPVSSMLREDGKIWVVIAVIDVVLTGLIYYIARLNNRFNRLKDRKQPLNIGSNNILSTV